MKELWRKVIDVSGQQARQSLAVLVASALGAVLTTAFLDWRVAYLQEGTWQVRLALTVGAVMIYVIVVWTSFYVLMPGHRPALKRIFPWLSE
ncbi:MAG TPA: hypothetical protein VE553_09805 [Candidatus Binatia bacterium]|nr:hypothetical protein [Candidatus Binatia bacterium]